MSDKLTRARSCVRVGALIVGLAMLVSACGYTKLATKQKQESPSTRPYWCNAVGNGTPPGGHGNGAHVNPHYEGMTKGQLSWDDCLKLSNELDAAFSAGLGLDTAADAEAAGRFNAAGYVVGLGTHHATELIPGGEPRPFDPAKPDFLIYGGPGPDAPLVGLSYAAPASEDPPEGFTGDNDWWHLHKKICYGNRMVLAGGEEITDEECDALGGNNFPLPGGGRWLLHVWHNPEIPLKADIFMSGHPCLGEDGPLPKSDPCWDIADHDPADGPYPGMDPGEHDDSGDHDEHGP